MAKLKFKETQRFRHWEVIALLAILSLGTAIRLAVSAVSDASTDGSTILLGIFLLVSLLLTLTYFLKVKMKVRVDSKGIKYSIYPWNKNKHKIKWKDVENIEIIDSPEQAALSGWFVNTAVVPADGIWATTKVCASNCQMVTTTF